MRDYRRLLAGCAASLAAASGHGAAGDLKHPDWHPGGALLISEGSCAGGIGLYLIDVDTGEVRLIFDSPHVDGYPRWFSDGERIAFHQIDSDGGATVSVARASRSGALESIVSVTTGPFDIEPAPSPDGRMLAFSVAGERGQDIAVMSLAGRAKTVWQTDGPENFPSWTPDGESILYHGGVSGERQILRRALRDGTVTGITDSGGPNIVAHMDGNGARLVFSSERDGDREIYVRNLADGTEDRLTSRAGRDGYPKFSPDGSRIAYHATLDDGRTVVRVLDLASHDSRTFGCAGELPAKEL